MLQTNNENQIKRISRLRQILIDQNISIEKMAARIECSSASLIKWLKNKRKPNMINQRKIDTYIKNTYEEE